MACGFLCPESKPRAQLVVLSGTNYFLLLLFFVAPLKGNSGRECFIRVPAGVPSCSHV